MSTHNICFHREIRKIICGYPFLSVELYAMDLRFCGLCFFFLTHCILVVLCISGL